MCGRAVGPDAYVSTSSISFVVKITRQKIRAYVSVQFSGPTSLSRASCRASLAWLRSWRWLWVAPLHSRPLKRAPSPSRGTRLPSSICGSARLGHYRRAAGLCRGAEMAPAFGGARIRARPVQSGVHVRPRRRQSRSGEVVHTLGRAGGRGRPARLRALARAGPGPAPDRAWACMWFTLCAVQGCKMAPTTAIGRTATFPPPKSPRASAWRGTGGRRLTERAPRRPVACRLTRRGQTIP
jgi:hypothetical protein